MNPVLSQSPPYAFAELDRKKDELLASDKRVYDFSIGDPKEPTPPFIREALIAAIPEISQYPRVVGTPELRGTIAAYLERRFGVTIDPETEVIPCAGAKEAIFHLPLALVDRDSPKKRVIYGEPGYPVYERGAAYAGGIPHPVSLHEQKGFLLEPGDIPEEILSSACLMWLNYPHNPTGAMADVAYYQRVLEAAERYDFVVASDETYADLWFGNAPPSLLEISRKRVLIIHSLSKRSGMTGYRSGFIAGDSKLIAALKKQRPSMGVASQTFVQAAASKAWADDAHAAERRALFAQKREKVLELCRGLNLNTQDAAGSLYVWIQAPGGDDLGYCEALLSEGVVATPGPSFGPSGRGWFRIALVPSLEQLDEALAAWRRAHLAFEAR